PGVVPPLAPVPVAVPGAGAAGCAGAMGCAGPVRGAGPVSGPVRGAYAGSVSARCVATVGAQEVVGRRLGGEPATNVPPRRSSSRPGESVGKCVVGPGWSVVVRGDPWCSLVVSGRVRGVAGPGRRRGPAHEGRPARAGGSGPGTRAPAPPGAVRVRVRGRVFRPRPAPPPRSDGRRHRVARR